MRTKFLALCLIIITSTLFSQNWQNAKAFGINFGAYKFLGDQIDLAAMGDWNGFAMSYGISPFISFSLEANYGSFKPKKPGSFYQKDTEAPYRTFVFPVVASMRLTCVRDGRIKPYLTAGTGILFWDLRDISTESRTFWDLKSFRWGSRISGFRKNILVATGIGIEFNLSRHVFLDLKTRFNSLLELKRDNVGYNDANNQILEGAMTLGFTFGGFTDTDHDGIEDKHDLAPFDAEDFDNFEDSDGKPDPDNDNDGVLDLYDRCPTEQEDHDGWQDSDGCPDLDNDYDGIPDITDQCPNTPEDFDGFQDQDGCPDFDMDGDGIPDVCDKCPCEAETKNNYQDDDGCPDAVPQQKKISETAPVQEDKFVLQGINFKLGSADLMPDSYPALEQVVELLTHHPDLRLEIRGHTDNQGDSKYNEKLSLKRANTVKEFLLDQGIAAERLTATGVGDRDPVASNKTAEGRAQNRRIEFVRLK